MVEAKLAMVRGREPCRLSLVSMEALMSASEAMSAISKRSGHGSIARKGSKRRETKVSQGCTARFTTECSCTVSLCATA